ncbi:MAG: metal-dependent transcriptional regulator [Candidatus Hydrothermarchaeales archaeon]
MEPSENVEEYLETLWILEEQGYETARINQVAESLKISPPSAVEMLRKMEGMGLVEYKARKGVSLTETGRGLAREVIRNHRLAELLLTDILKMKVDEEAACGIEHHLSEKIAEAVCKALDHPRRCPHGTEIPAGKCCPRP